MGSNKALLPWQGSPMAVHIAGRLSHCTEDVVVITKRPSELTDLDLRVEKDRFRVQTPLAGIATALRLAEGRKVFVMACDMPMVEPELVRMMLRRSSGFQAVVPERDGRLEPLHAVWCPTAEAAVKESLRKGETSPTRVLAKLRILKLPQSMWKQWDPAEMSMANINTKEDYMSLKGAEVADDLESSPLKR